MVIPKNIFCTKKGCASLKRPNLRTSQLLKCLLLVTEYFVCLCFQERFNGSLQLSIIHLHIRCDLTGRLVSIVTTSIHVMIPYQITHFLYKILTCKWKSRIFSLKIPHLSQKSRLFFANIPHLTQKSCLFSMKIPHLKRKSCIFVWKIPPFKWKSCILASKTPNLTWNEAFPLPKSHI